MKQEPGGWRVIDSPKLRSLIQHLGSKTSFVYPMSFAAAQSSGKDNWDLVSLESSEFDETGSADSGSSALFPMLGSSLAALHSASKKAISLGIADCCVPSSSVSPSTAGTTAGNAVTGFHKIPGGETTKLDTDADNKNKPKKPPLSTPSPLVPLIGQNKSVKTSPTLNLTKNSGSNIIKSWPSPPNHLKSIIKNKMTGQSFKTKIDELEISPSSSNSDSSPDMINESCRYNSLSAAVSQQLSPVFIPKASLLINCENKATAGDLDLSDCDTDIQEEISPNSIQTFEQDGHSDTESSSVRNHLSSPDTTLASCSIDNLEQNNERDNILRKNNSSKGNFQCFLENELLSDKTSSYESNSSCSETPKANALCEPTTIGYHQNNIYEHPTSTTTTTSTSSDSQPLTPEADDEAALYIVNNWDNYTTLTYSWPILWDRLEKIGWIMSRVKFESLFYHLIIPSWSIAKFYSVGKRFEFLCKNRDYFLDQLDVKNYISEHGLQEIDGSLTPSCLPSGNNDRSFRPRNVSKKGKATEKANDEDKTKSIGLSSAIPIIKPTNLPHDTDTIIISSKTDNFCSPACNFQPEEDGISVGSNSSCGPIQNVYSSSVTPESDHDAAIHILNNWGKYSNSTYPWPLLWERLSNLGWKELKTKKFNLYPLVFVPSWAIDLFYDNKQNPSKLEINKEYFLDPEEIKNYLSKYGLVNYNSNSSDSLSKNHNNLSMNTNLLATFKSPDESKIEGNNSEDNNPTKNEDYISQETFIDSTPIADSEAASYIVENWDKYAKLTYPWNLLWDRLSKLGWEIVQTKDFLMSSDIIVPNWSLNKIKKSGCNPNKFTRNCDYFVDKCDVKNFILEYGTFRPKNFNPPIAKSKKRVSSLFQEVVEPSKTSTRRKLNFSDSLLYINKKGGTKSLDSRKMSDEIESEFKISKDESSSSNGCESSSSKSPDTIGVLCSLQNHSVSKSDSLVSNYNSSPITSNISGSSSSRLPSRSARVRPFKKDDALGSWPTRYQCALAGSWQLKAI